MRIGIIFGNDTATTLEMTLVLEFARVLPDARIFVFTDADPARVTWAERLRRRVDTRIARSREFHVPLSSLASRSIEVSSLAGERDVAEALRAARCDALIDVGAAIEGRELGTVSPRIYQLWCDGRRDTLRFAGLIDGPRDRRQRICWTVRRPDEGLPLLVAESSLLWTPATVTYNRDRAAGRAVALLMRVFRAGRDANEGPAWSGVEARHVFTVSQSLRAARSVVADAVQRRFTRMWLRHDVWFIAYRSLSAKNHSQSTFRRWGTDRQRWVADPFAFRHQGIDYLFFEDFSYSMGRGVISWTSLRPDGSLGRPEVALVRDYHLSYPFVFSHEGEVYMIPETAENRTVELYRALEFPQRWELIETLLDNVNAVDATLHFDGRRWWMFVNIGEYGSSTWDELFLFSAESPRGKWLPHPQNPVKSDPSSARPAGRLFHSNGQLIRPTQDCSLIYGGGIVLCAIETLDELHFRERVVGTIGPEWLEGTQGVHTVNASDGIQVIDGKLAHRPIWWRGYPDTTIRS